MDLSLVKQILEDRCTPEPNTGCWLWLGAVSSNGYGHFELDGKTLSAHRMSIFVYKGESPEVVMHLCNNKICVNPQHLKGGTSSENFRQAINDGLANRKRNLTRCPQGHECTPENAKVSLGKTRCKECHRLACLRYSRAHSLGKRRRKAKGE